MPSDNVIPLFPRREAAARWRRRARAACGLAGALALAFAPVTAVAERSTQLPPGHPPVDTQRLPPGHPPIDGGDGASACSPDLPPGHPSVRDPNLPEGHPPVEITPCGPGATSNGVFQPAPSANVPGLIET
jgi:hypothetical protein